LPLLFRGSPPRLRLRAPIAAVVAPALQLSILAPLAAVGSQLDHAERRPVREAVVQ
jgi:hypothetical protein